MVIGAISTCQRYDVVNWLLLSIIYLLYLIGVLFGEDHETNTQKTHVLKEIQVLLVALHSVANDNRDDMYIQLRN